MNRIITKQQIEAVLKLAQKYNMGIQEYSALAEMLNTLPEEKVEEKEVDKK